MKKQLGQYFTTNKTLQDKVFEFIKNSPERILEPSVGRGDLIVNLMKYNPKIKLDLYEIDKDIEFVIDKNLISFCDFLKEDIKNKYMTIIGNPPYIKSKHGNIYLSFIEKCFYLLKNNGELIFIIPSDFFKLTSSSKLLDEMLKKGTFTDIYHPHNEKLFDNASIDIIIFRYVKNSKLDKKVLYNDEELYINNIDGYITFSKCKISGTKICDLFDVYVGLVSGKEDIYKNKELGNITVLNDMNKFDNYIYVKKYPCGNKDVDEYLHKHKNILIKRKIRKFNEKNWFEWGAPRNIHIMEKCSGEKCIYIKTLTRNDTISFVGTVSYFGGGLIMIKPHDKNINLEKIAEQINSPDFKSNFIYSGRYKIGHRQICNSYISNIH